MPCKKVCMKRFLRNVVESPENIFWQPYLSCDRTSAANVITSCVSSVMKVPSSVDGQVCSRVLHGGQLLTGTHVDYRSIPSFCGHLCTWLQHMRAILICKIVLWKVLKCSFKAHLWSHDESNETSEMFNEDTFITILYEVLNISRRQRSTEVKWVRMLLPLPPLLWPLNALFLVL